LRHHEVDTGIGQGAEPLTWRPVLTQIRVHELASELNVSTQQVLDILADLGQKVRGPSTVIGVSAAAKVRGRCRLPKSSSPNITPAVVTGHGASSGAPNAEAIARIAAPAPPAPDLATTPAPSMAAAMTVPATVSLFLPPVAPAVAFSGRGPDDAFANPFTVPAPKFPRTSPAPGGQLPSSPRPVGNRVVTVPLVIEPEPSLDALWRARGINAADQARWLRGGLRPAEAEVADRCRSAGIAPEELSGKLSGRTALQRLRDGEATTSVWARIREAEQQPRRTGTRLTGRFQLS
jgi:hypothetical protein